MSAQVAEAVNFDVAAMQAAICDEGFDGWLFYHFHDIDPIALRILKLTACHFVSRRWFYFVPAVGEPVKLVHRIEMDSLDELPGEKVVYLGWQELESKLRQIISGHKKLAMQYSPGNAIPYISRVDAGTVELVRSCGCEVVSSANLVQYFEARLSAEQLKSHLAAGVALKQIVFDAFAYIATAIKEKRKVNEYEVQQHILDLYDKNGLTSNSPPIVAVNAHSGKPHYQPTANSFWEIQTGDFVLLDIWAKQKSPADAVYADITWTGYLGDLVPEKFVKIFDIVRGARDAALNFVTEAVSAGKQIHGWQVDDAARKYIGDAGYGDYFVHRTGHSICTEVHANGANIDNLETRDERKIIPQSVFSIEPGIYLDEFGVRSEIDVYVGHGEVIVAGQPIQTAVVPILSI